MAKYGYIENGFLRAREVEQGQVQNLSSEWKPVDDIDESKTISDDDNYTIRLVPYDNGNRISFNYEKVVNTTKIQGEIDAIKAELSETDYQVIKCYEASLVGEELPYDIKALHEDRNEKRAQINALETNLTNLMAL
jgi:hypothetical protein|uniref:Uncharacterized protein n=1 Tax=Siphoviridae sp. ctCS019 TaxID=2825378 RepID=A0A8S5U5F1_9CAUD|nr:MAG: hypothetical protein [Bacteriophage sp.]DAF89675.1 MAG TPA: hypothetical protein [Siphoviridae sp. ctCS019]DAK70508.1 MAG TPA: hypothetical protein [Caudoviricetes sp.]